MGEDPGRIREQIAETREQLSGNTDADRIRSDIQETREQMSETVEALGHKADVKTRVKDSISDTKDTVVEKADTLVHKVTGAMPDGTQVKQGAQKVGLSKENPLGLAIGGAAVGFLAGLLLPSTRIEDENLGEISDQVMEQVKETGQDAFERGKQVAQETLATAKETAVESGTELGKNVADELKQTARDAAHSGSPNQH